jgi:hypothetical protein
VIVWTDGRQDPSGESEIGHIYAQSVKATGELGSDQVTAILLTLFEAQPTEQGVALRWRFGDPGAVAAVTIERRHEPGGSWEECALERRREGENTVALDRTVSPGESYSYRLIVETTSGSASTSAPLRVGPNELIRSFEIASVVPNPTPRGTTVQYTMPREAEVRLSVLDLQGREVAVLVDGRQRSGAHFVTWNGMAEQGPVPAGVYFLRLTTPIGRFATMLVVFN